VPPRIPPKPRAARQIERSIDIGCSVERLFRFHRDTRNVPRVTRNVDFLSITGDFPLEDGGNFEMRMRPRFVPRVFRWRFVVEAVVHNSAVVSVALESPFPYWRHEHRFEDLGHGRSRLTDRVQYLPPLPGPLAKMAGGFIDSRLEKMISERLALTKKLLEARR